MKNLKLPAIPLTVTLACLLLSPARAQWLQNSNTGSYNYTATSNWNGGVINNIFATNITAALTITFGANYALSSQMLLGWSNAATVTFESASSTPETIQFSPNGGIAVTNSVGGTINIGTSTNPLVLDLNGSTNCTIGGVTGTSGSGNSTMNVTAQIIDSGGTTNAIKFSGDRTFTYLLNTNNTFIGPVNFFALRGGSYASIKPIGGGPSSLGAPVDMTTGTISIGDSGSFGSLRYTGTGDTSDRPFVFNITFSNQVGNAYQLANAGTGLLDLTGPLTFPTNGTNGTQFVIYATNAPIELDGYIHGSGNPNGTYTYLGFIGGPNGTATNRVILTGLTNDFRDFLISNVVLNFNNLAAAGTPCAIGQGTNITLAGGSGGNANWPGTSGQGCTLQYVGPSATLSRNLIINCGSSQCYWGVDNAGTNTTLTISNNITWNLSTNVLTGFQPRYLFFDVNNFATNIIQSYIPDAGVVVGTTPIGIIVTAGGSVGTTVANGGLVQLLNPTNTFAGGVQVPYARTLQVTALANIGQPSSIGTGSIPDTMITPAIALTGINLGSTDSQRGGILSYIGTNNATCNQRITILGDTTGTLCSGTVRNDSPNGSSLHLSDTSAWNMDSLMPFCVAILGGSAAVTNTVDSYIIDVATNGAGSGSLLVNGSAWRFTAPQTYTGTTTVMNATMLMNGSIAAGLGTTVGSGGTLAGTGTINENVNVLTNGTIAAGDGALGTLTINGNLTNAGTVFMKLNKSTHTNDLLALGANTINYGSGTLVVTNLAGTLAVNDAFQLFAAGTYAGTFSSISPATPGAGLVWDLSSLPTNGVLKVAAGVSPTPPTITSFSISGANFSLSGTNGTANAAYNVVSATNVATPLTNWTIVASTNFDGSGNFSLTLTNIIQPSVPRQFFRIQVP